MSTISPSLQIGGVNGWKGKEGAVLGWQQTSGNLFKPAKFDFTRLSGSASYVDENGLIQIEHRPNYPRFTYQDGKQCLMNEEARTNLIEYSNTRTSWNLTRITRDSNDSRKGVEGAIYSDNGSGTPNILDGVTHSTGFHVFSVFIDATNSDDFQFNIGTDGVAANGVSVTFTPSTETFGTINENGTYVNSGSGFVGFEDFGDNVYRVWIGADFLSGPSNFTSIVYIGTGNSSVFVGGAQLEEGSYASSYIPTSGSAVTRAAESIEGLNLGNFLGDSQGGLYVEGLVFSNDFQDLSISDGTTDNSVFFQYNTDDTLDFIVDASASRECAINGGSFSANSFSKMFGAYALNDFAFYADGSEIGTDTSGSTPTGLSQMNFANGTGILRPLRGLIHEIRAYDQRPTNAQLESDTQ